VTLNKGAIIDPTGCYRYLLWREWEPNACRITFIMLNPSRADATVDDPTIRRCLGFAQYWGYGSLAVVNLFAYRTFNPTVLKEVSDPIGPENDQYLQETIQQGHLTVIAWGNRGNLNHRSQEVMKWLTELDSLYCLGVTHRGFPRHPLYLKKDTLLMRYCP